MRETKLQMNMPVTLEIIDKPTHRRDFKAAFDFIRLAEERFSFFRPASEVSKYNRGEIKAAKCSHDLKEILELAEKTKKETEGFFDINCQGKINPSGIVKGWVIYKVAQLLDSFGYKNFYIEAGGDIETRGFDGDGNKWWVGIRNPFHPSLIVKKVALSGQGIATSGNYYRGQHIYNPHQSGQTIQDIVSFTIIAENVLEADRFATAAFAMGKAGINFVEKKEGIEGYMIDNQGLATFTSNFKSLEQG